MSAAPGHNGNGINEPKSQKEAEEVFAGKPLTIDYRPGFLSSGLFPGGGNDDGGRFGDLWAHINDIERMIDHPDVRIPYAMYKAAISRVKFRVRAADETQAEEAHGILTKVWQNHFWQLQLRCDYGWNGYEIDYDLEDGGYLDFAALIDLVALDCHALTVGGEYRGFRLQGAMGGGVGHFGTAGSVDLWGPGGDWPAKGLWLTHDRRHDRFYGRSQLRGAWRPYRRLAGRDGAEDSIDGAVYRRAYQGPTVRYPERAFRRPGGGELDFDAARHEAMLMSQNLKAGASMALPNTKDEKGDYLWSVEWPNSDLTNLSALLSYEENLQKAISRGVGVPPELFEAAQTGSGYSGRIIPLQAFYETQTENARQVVRALVEQIVVPILRWNHGGDAWCEAEVEVVLPDILTGGQQPPGGAAGAPPAPEGGAPPPEEGQPPDAGGLGPLADLLPGGGTQLSLVADEDDGWLDPGWYHPDMVDEWSVPLEGWEMARPAQPARYQQKQITRGPRKGQTGWYDTQGWKFMPAAWQPAQQKQPAAPTPAPKRAARTAGAQPKAQKPPATPKPRAARTPKAQKPTAGGDAEYEAGMARIQGAMRKDLADRNHPLNRLKGQIADADFGAGPVGTVRGTKDSPLSVSDHEAMDRAHSRMAAAMKLGGDDSGADAQLAAAKYHRTAAEKKGQQQQQPPPQRLPRTVTYEALDTASGGGRQKALVAEYERKVWQGEPPASLPAAINAQDGAKVTVSGSRLRDDLTYEIDDKERGYEASRSFFRDEEGRLVVQNNTFKIHEALPDGRPNPMKGKGSEIFAEQVAALREAGVDRIETDAARDDEGDPPLNGYYTWARLGYDGEIPASTLGKLSPQMRAKLGGKTNVQSLMALPGGKEFWKIHGDSFDAKFDLSEGSQSLRVMRAYLDERKQKKKGGGRP